MKEQYISSQASLYSKHSCPRKNVHSPQVIKQVPYLFFPIRRSRKPKLKEGRKEGKGANGAIIGFSVRSGYVSALSAGGSCEGGKEGKYCMYAHKRRSEVTKFGNAMQRRKIKERRKTFKR